MLSSPGTSNLVRAQGFVSDDEINDMADCLKENNEPPNFAEEIQDQIDSSGEEGSSSGIGGEDGDDALLGGAIDVLRTKRATSMLQRRLRIGYNRATASWRNWKSAASSARSGQSAGDPRRSRCHVGVCGSLIPDARLTGIWRQSGELFSR